MTGDAGSPVAPVPVETACRHCGHDIETTLRVSTALVHGGTIRIRCAECGRPTPYQEGERPDATPEWFIAATAAESVVRFDGGVEG
jgi:DNA-directed RNA polymerase subunit RPC12/RpoP